MNVLILNWRDIKNPRGGGAEVLTHEIAKRLVRFGHNVTQFSSKFDGSKELEIIDGVRFIRKGHPDARFLFFSVHFLAFFYYLKEFKGKYDVVIDEVHGLPFFTPWYVSEKKVLLVCEVAGNLWDKMFGPFFGKIGRFSEWLYLHYIYKDIPFLAISESTKEDLVKEGVKESNITVLPMGITFPDKLKGYEKEKDPTLIFVGRLTRSKGIEDAISVLKILSGKIPNVKLWIVGRGDEAYLKKLKSLAKSLGVEDNITFWGFVTEERKFELLAKAWVLVASSMKEGWGLTIPEAASQGTPSVAYDVEGLRDVVKEGINGFKVKKGDKNELAEKILNLIEDKSLYSKLQALAKKSSIKYNWDTTARAILKVLENE